MKKILGFALSAVLAAASFTSCTSEDGFTESIYDTNVKPVDPDKATYEFDKWLYENFVKPYNVEVQYQFNFNASDMTFQLSPAEYNRAQLLSHFMRYLFYDVYTKYAKDGDQFMRKYSPRMFHFIGSSGFSPTTGTEVLGTASGGVKITLYNVNEMKPWSENVKYDNDDIMVLNERFFHTMHHEFSHILHQTKSYPVSYGHITSKSYDPQNWQDRDSTTTHRLGFVTHYASSANTEDFVETLSCIITDTETRWMNRVIAATINGVATAEEKEQILELIKNLNIHDLNNPQRHWNNFKVYKELEYNSETDTYDETGNLCYEDFRSSAQVINKAHTAYVNQYRYTEPVEYKSFVNAFLPSVKVTSDAKSVGIDAILQKIEIASTWYTEKWGFNIYELREEVQQRQRDINEFLPTVTIYDLKK